MVRLQVQFSAEQDQRLRAVALRRNISVAELVRRCVERALDPEAPARAALYEQAAKLVGSLEGAPSDLAAAHDHHLARDSK